MNNRQSGSAAFIIIACIASISLAIMFTELGAKRSLSALKEANQLRIVEEKNIGAMSAIAIYKSLVNPKRIGEEWKPAIFAKNYFDSKWQMKAITYSSAGFRQISTEKTSLRLRQPVLNDRETLAVMSGQSPNLEDFTIRFIKPNFNDSKKLVESVDIEVTGRQKISNHSEDIKVFARVRIPPPVPYNPQLLYRSPGGSWSPVKEGADLSAGPYEFIARVSGIAFDGDLLVNGQRLQNYPNFGGRNSEGIVQHKAVTYDNVGGEMGPTYLLDFAQYRGEKKTVGKTSPAKKKENFSSDGTSCGFVKGSYSNTESGTAEEHSGDHEPQSATLQLVIRGPDGKSERSSTDVYKVIIDNNQKNEGRVDDDNDDRVLTATDYKQSCTAECPYIGDGDTGAEIGGYAGFKGPGPISSRWTMKEAQEKWGIMDKKVCFRFPGAPKLGYDQQNSEVWAYDPKTCKGEKLFKRGACGCLTGDTLITLGDGKTQKRIEDLAAWDRVWNPVTRRSTEVRRYTVGPENKPLVQIKVGGEVIQATEGHPFITLNGLKRALELTESDSLRSDLGDWVKISEISKIDPGEEPPLVWNLELEDEGLVDEDSHFVLANGIVTGDLWLQESLHNNYQQRD